MLSAATLGMMAQGFEIKGNIPGIQQGTKIELKIRERSNNPDFGKTVVESTDGTFTITGSVASPTLAELYINSNNPDELSKVVELMIENAPYSISTAHIDSVAPSFYAGTVGLMKTRNVTVDGGNAQKQ